MDEMKELLLVWTIALLLMLAGIGIAQYATREPQFALESAGSR